MFVGLAQPLSRNFISASNMASILVVHHNGRFQVVHGDLRLGRGLAQHALIAGKTGSGKSNLLHVIITNLALWYSPDEVEFYLVDFKKGVEFKVYVTQPLPHARAVAHSIHRHDGR